MSDQSWVWPTWLSIDAMCMGRSALTAVSPGTRTVPGTANPAPDILPHRRGEGQDCVDREYINEADEVQQQSICTSLLPTSAVGVFMQISYFSSVFRLNFISVAVDLTPLGGVVGKMWSMEILSASAEVIAVSVALY